MAKPKDKKGGGGGASGEQVVKSVGQSLGELGTWSGLGCSVIFVAVLSVAGLLMGIIGCIGYLYTTYF